MKTKLTFIELNLRVNHEPEIIIIKDGKGENHIKIMTELSIADK